MHTVALSISLIAPVTNCYPLFFPKVVPPLSRFQLIFYVRLRPCPPRSTDFCERNPFHGVRVFSARFGGPLSPFVLPIFEMRRILNIGKTNGLSGPPNRAEKTLTPWNGLRSQKSVERGGHGRSLT